MVAEHVVVRQRVAEEVAALEPASDGFALVVMTHHRGDTRHLGVDGVADGHTALGKRSLVVTHPVHRFLGVDERERQRADAVLGREQDRVATRARHPEGRVGLLHGLGNDVARRHLHVRAVGAGER